MFGSVLLKPCQLLASVSPDWGPSLLGDEPVRPMTPEQAVAVDSTTKTWPDLILSAEVDADLEDEKFKRTEMIGLDRVFKGFAQMKMSDQEILIRGFEMMDALYVAIKR